MVDLPLHLTPARPALRALGLGVSLLTAACSGPASPPTAPASTIDVRDGRTVRRLVLVAAPDAQIEVLRALEVPVLSAEVGPDGRSRLTIEATAKFAASLARHGFELVTVEPVATPGEGLESTSEALVADCSQSPLTADEIAEREAYFPRYDGRGGLAEELLGMADSAAAISVRAIGASVERRPILGVKFGPLAKEVSGPVPTAVLLAAHHSNEWGSLMTALELARHVEAVAKGEVRDPELWATLERSAVVIVPSVNPDGYQYSRTVYRDQRANRHAHGCEDPDLDGVDINRNYPVGWATPADSAAHAPCTGVYVGTGAASEPETQAVMSLLTNPTLFGGAPIVPVAAVSYHTFGNLVLYPSGFKSRSDAAGPACDMNANCTNADFQLHRNVFGDTESPIHREPGTRTPFLTGPINNVIYTAPGDFLMFADRKASTLAATVELAFGTHYVECRRDYRARVRANMEQQRELVLRMLGEVRGLEATSRADAYAVRTLGVMPSGLWTRERSERAEATAACPAPAFTPLDALTQAQRAEWQDYELCLDGFAKPRFTKPHYRKDGVVPPLQSTLDDQRVALAPLRRGNHYDLFGFDASSLRDPLCLPCEIWTSADGGKPSGDVVPGCRRGCVDLRDPDRFPGRKASWSLVTEVRGGEADAVWIPRRVGSSADDDLVLGDVTLDRTDLTHCHLTFTTETNGGFGGQVELLRDGEVVHRWPEAAPNVDARVFTRMRSYAVEASGGLPARVPELRFRVTRDPSGNVPFKLFDPVLYCRVGPLGP